MLLARTEGSDPGLEPSEPLGAEPKSLHGINVQLPVVRDKEGMEKRDQERRKRGKTDPELGDAL